MSSVLGGLGTRVDLLKQNFTLSMVGAATGVCFPIALSYLLLYLGFGYGVWRSSISGVELMWTRRGGDFYFRRCAFGYLIGYVISS